MLFLTVCFLTFIFEASAVIFEASGCETSSFKNARATVSGRTKEDLSDVILNDCVENNAETRTYFTIQMINQNIEKLNRGAFVNLPVQTLVLSNNRISQIDRDAFQNIRSAQTLDLSKNRITTLLSNVFNDLISMKILDLSQNRIEEIENETFAHLVSLEELKLSYNKIKVWNSNWFANNIAIKKIDLESNLLEVLPAYSFKDMDKLSTLILRENMLREIDENAFRDLKGLKELDISVNKLTKLHKNTFIPFNGKIEDNVQSKFTSMDATFYKAFSGLSRLYMHTNNITYLADKIMEDLSNTRNLIFLTVHANPWQCGCYKKILKWADDRRIRVNSMGKGCYRKDNPVCIVPKENPKGCVEDVQEDIRSLYFSMFQTPVNDFFDRNVVCNNF